VKTPTETEKDIFFKALTEEKGLHTKVWHHIGGGLSYHKLMKEDEVFAEKVEALKWIEKEKINDQVEEKIREKLLTGEIRTIIHYSKTQMQDRGYVEKKVFDHTSGGKEISNPVTFVIKNGNSSAGMPWDGD
jgi:hypothetical protein